MVCGSIYTSDTLAKPTRAFPSYEKRLWPKIHGYQTRYYYHRFLTNPHPVFTVLLVAARVPRNALPPPPQPYGDESRLESNRMLQSRRKLSDGLVGEEGAKPLGSTQDKDISPQLGSKTY